ncbi:MAG: hypothetical protein KF796_19525 [Ramlibacter sp.]|nr:hypothetical protein [Ramlibacter sp.]
MSSKIGRPTGGAYKPLKGSIAARVSYWFAMNRDEQLTRNDVVAKFQVLPASVDGNLSRLIEQDWLKRDRLADTSVVFVAGPALPPASDLEPLVGPSPRDDLVQALRPPSNLRGRVPILDLASVQIDKGVPMPVSRGKFGQGAASVLLKMEIGDSVCLPHRQAAALRDAYNHIKKEHPTRKYALRKVDDDSSRPWRTE